METIAAKRFDGNTFSPKPGITLIEASAGTGKTYSITQIVCNLVSSGRCRIDEVLVLTFTEPATQELRDRIRKGIIEQIENAINKSDERAITHLSEALDNFESASIYTIHGFCNRILREFSVDAGLGPEFAILKNPKEFESRLLLKVARNIQSLSNKNPFIATGIQALGHKSSFFKNVLNLKESDDLAKASLNASDLGDWFQDRVKALSICWNESHARIRAELLSDNPPINRRRAVYKTENLIKQFDHLENFFKSNRLYLSFFEDLNSLAWVELNDPKVLKKDRAIQPNSFYQECDQVASALTELETALISEIWKVKEEEIHQLVYQEQQLRFDDLLTFARDILCRPNAGYSHRLFEQFKVGLIDEFQDTDPIQVQVLDQIFLNPPVGENQRPLILIGDPKQAIYGFRGGDIFTYNSAKERANEIYFLDTNWRSSPAINQGVNELLTMHAQPFIYDWIDYQPVETAKVNTSKSLILRNDDQSTISKSGIDWVTVEEGASEHGKFQKLAVDIAQLLNLRNKTAILTKDGQRRLSAKDIVVLVPSNEHGAKAHEALGTQGIPATIFGGASVFESPEAKQLYAILTAMLNPKDRKLVRAAISSKCFDPSLAHHFHNSEIESDGAAVLRTFGHAGNLWQSKGLAAAINFLELSFRLKENLSKAADPNRSLANYQHLINLLFDQLIAENQDPLSLMGWFQGHLEAPDSKDQDQLLQLDTDAEAVTIMTMHKSKGLEFPLVFIPVLPEVKSGRSYPNQYHVPETGELRTNFSKKSTTLEVESNIQKEMTSEALRILYVAITRAEIYCAVYLNSDPKIIDKSIILSWLPASDDLSGRLEKLNHTCQKTESPTDLRISDSSETSNSSSKPNLVPPTPPPSKTPLSRHLSFTGIVHGASSQQDELEQDEPLLFNYHAFSSTDVFDANQLTIFDFDKGTNAGLMFHDLLECISFSDSSRWSQTTNEILEKFGYSAELWTPVMLNWIHQLLSTEVQFADGSTFSLNEFAGNSMYRETEFSFPVQWNLEIGAKLQTLFSESKWIQSHNWIPPEISVLHDYFEAFVNGVIDFWAFRDDKVYLIDWKSNFLGKQSADYNEIAMKGAMADHHYHLQYLLYICALNRYLRLVDSSYDYATHFGGVGYCFLRGVNAIEPDSGWFTTMPPATFIYELETILFPTLFTASKSGGSENG